MKKLFAALLLVPTLAVAFEPVSLPHCTPAGPGATDAEVISSAKCRYLWIMASSYNDNKGKMPDAMYQCAGVLDETMFHRIETGPKHDSHVAVCMQAALHLGFAPSIFN
jgi:hypothetical protein